MLKTITAKFLSHSSYLGEAVFQNVPVQVEEEVDESAFDPAKDDFSISGDIIFKLEKEIARRWLRDFLKRDADGNLVSRGHITSDEVHGIMLFLGLKKIQFAKLLGLDRSTVTRIIKGEKTIAEPSTRLCILILSAELKKAGSAQKLLKYHVLLDERTLEPHFDLKELKLA